MGFFILGNGKYSSCSNGRNRLKIWPAGQKTQADILNIHILKLRKFYTLYLVMSRNIPNFGTVFVTN